jgi:predicted RNase H-like HicB family nuclease
MCHYIALLHKEVDSDYGVSFPDLPGCITGGKTLDEALTKAEEVLAFHLVGMAEDADLVPEPSSLEEIMSDAENRDSLAFLVEVKQMNHFWPPASFTLTKDEAAVRQVNAAIEAFYRGSYDICITLAGAAEQIYSERKGTDLFSFFRNHPKTQELTSDEFKQALNDERDWLKHPTPNKAASCSFSSFEAAFMLIRAMSKLEHWSDQMNTVKPLLIETALGESDSS